VLKKLAKKQYIQYVTETEMRERPTYC